MARRGTREWSIDIIADSAATLDRERLDMDAISGFLPLDVKSVAIRSRAYLKGLRSLCHIVMRPDEARPAVDGGPGPKSATLLLVTMDEAGRTSDMTVQWARARPDLILRTVVSVHIPEVVDEAAMNTMLRWRCQHMRQGYLTPRVVFADREVATSDPTLWQVLCRPRDEECSIRLIVAGASWLSHMSIAMNDAMRTCPGVTVEHVTHIDLFAADDVLAQAAEPTMDEARLPLELRRRSFFTLIIAVALLEEGKGDAFEKVLEWLEKLRWPPERALVLQVLPRGFPVCGCGDYASLRELCRRGGVDLMAASNDPLDIARAMRAAIASMVQRCWLS
jgi:hypothetical protein